MVVIAVHDGSFHADDVFAVAIMQFLYPDAKVIRTRDEEKLKAADFRIDVGFSYDPKSGDFDHHQKDAPKPRENDIPYASCGLVWKEFGEKICGSEDVCLYVDKKLIQFLDAADSGFETYEAIHLRPYTIAQVIDSYNPLWNVKHADYDAAFLEAVGFAKSILEKEIKKGKAKLEAYDIVREALAKSDGKIVVLEEFCPWHEVVIEESEAYFVLFKDHKGYWRIRAVPMEKGSFSNRVDLPALWGGKQGDELIQVCGVSDAVFCHKALFIASAKSLEGAKKMAELALKDKGL